MPHLGPLGLEVFLVLLGDRRDHRDPAHHGEPVPLEPNELGRVVRHQPHRAHANVPENLGADAVLAGVDGEAELDVGLHRVAALVLQVVGAELLAEPDAAAFMAAQVHEYSAAGLLDQLHREVQLLAAVAAGRAEDVAGQALRVHPHEHVFPIADIALGNSDVLSSIQLGLVAVGAEEAPFGRQTRYSDQFHQFLPFPPVP